MPNWCSNTIHLEGPAEKISQVWEQCNNPDTDDGLLSAIAPLEGDWEYNSAISHWGTKWDVETDSLSYRESGDSGIIEGYFESAWSPPQDACEIFLQNNPDCNIELLYYEPANDFCGTLEASYEISRVGKDFFTDTHEGNLIDTAFGVVDTLEEWEDEVQTEILSEPLTLTDPNEETI